MNIKELWKKFVDSCMNKEEGYRKVDYFICENTLEVNCMEINAFVKDFVNFLKKELFSKVYIVEELPWDSPHFVDYVTHNKEKAEKLIREEKSGNHKINEWEVKFE